MLHSVWSLDDGYGDLKGHNGTCTLLLPSFYTRYRPFQKPELEDVEIDPYSHIGVKVDNRHLLVGQGALDQDMKIQWNGGENKHLDHGFPILLKTCLALMTGETKSVTLDPLVMGLPVKAEESKERHKLLQGIVQGFHQVEVTTADGKVYSREIYVKELVTKKQPFGSFCDVILDKNGDIKEKEIASQFNVIIDIGARTLNIYTLNALDPVYDLCDTTNDGIFTAYEWVGNFIADQLNLPLPNGKLPNIVKKQEIKGIDLRQPIMKSYETLANAIRTIVDTKFVDSWVFVDRVIFTGGGAEVLRPWLSKYFIDKNVMFLGRHSTARGLRKYGMRHVKKRVKTAQK